LSAARNCTRDEGGPFEFGDQEPISSHRHKLTPKSCPTRAGRWNAATSRDKPSNTRPKNGIT